MIHQTLFAAVTLVMVTLLIYQTDTAEESAHVMLDRSAPYVGAHVVNELGYTGKGITVAVIDTGVSSDHPDLYGFGMDKKIIGGTDFIDGGAPEDLNGHGTQVAGIIAADGILRGIAPAAKIVSYRVSEDGESVSSDLIIRAIKRAVNDGVDVINISLGVNKTNPKINTAVNEAVAAGVVVVAAAGNDGPTPESIGSPGISLEAITVGATYNNITSSPVATLHINDRWYDVLPMTGTEGLTEPIVADIVFGGYARAGEIGQADGRLVLAERGSDIDGQLVYFSQKEENAARAGASAIIVYNNEEGMFLGELLHDFVGPEYTPKIPALSISREDGLEIKDMLDDGVTAKLHVFYDPDHIAHFSSRGPVSPFYNKPDIVAPGIFVNTTSINGAYNSSSGTSFATPHISGAVAILLERHPELDPHQVKSILMTTTSVISDAYGNEFPTELAGSGRLDVKSALGADLVIVPPMLSFNLSVDKKEQTETLYITSLDGLDRELDIVHDIPGGTKLQTEQKDGHLRVTASLANNTLGSFQGRMWIDDGSTTYNVPLLFDITEGTILTSEQDGRLSINISHPREWSYAKVTVIDADAERDYTVSVLPDQSGVVSLNGPGTYWIESSIQTDNGTSFAYNVVTTHTVAAFDPLSYVDIPYRPVLIIAGVIAVASLLGVRFGRTRRADLQHESQVERL